METIYFDYAATTPVDPLVADAMTPYLYERFGNASSPHSIGRTAQKALEDSRVNLANFIGAKPSEVFFTSGATESNNHAIYGVAHANQSRGKHIIVSQVEHHSVLEPCEFLQSQGYQVTYLKVDDMGRVRLDELEKAIKDETILVAIMHASNEIGTIQPIEEICRMTKEKNIPLLVDACQTIGHVEVNVDTLGVDLLSLSAHKFYGPKGVGAMYVREKTPLEKFIRGGDQERNMRASTQNVCGIVGLSKAIDLCKDLMKEEYEQHTQFRNQLMTEIPKKVKGVKVNGDPSNRLANNIHFSFDHLEGEALLMSLDMNHVAASMGSACTSGAMEPSHVLRAIGVSDELAYGSLRLSMGRWTTQEHIDYLIVKIPELIASLRV